VRQRAWHCLVAAFAAIGLLTAPTFAAVTVKGDQAAWADVMAAYKKLYSLSGFRVKMAGEAGVQSVMEVVPPDKYHMTSQTPNGGMEMITVGDKTAFKMSATGAPNTWQCHSLPQNVTPRDPTTAEGTVEVSRGADTAIDGTPVHTYVYTNAGTQSGASAKTTLYVGSQNGLPKRMVVEAGSSEHQITMDYYDYGAPITIALPQCPG